LVFKSVLQRICKEINNRIKNGNTIEVDLYTFAQKVASSRETVSRMLSLLEKIGIIQHKRNKTIVIDKERIKKIAE
jgi:DNA-binding transcriptional regulator YhcF (GntR family)